MNRTTKVLLAAGGLLVAAYPGYAWLTGIVVEHRIERAEQRLSREAPYLAIAKRDYRRGVYRSIELVTYEIHQPGPPTIRSGQVIPVPASFTLTIRNTIRHGPLPGLRTVALATIDSTLVLPPAVRQQISKLLGSQPIVRVHTQIGWLADTQSMITAPAFSWRAADGSTIAWRGLSGKISSHAALSSWSAQVTAPGLTVRTAGGGHFELLGLAFSGRARKVFDAIYAGRSRFAIDRLDSAEPRTGGTYALRHLAVSTNLNVHGKFLDTRFNASADAAQFGTVALSHFLYSASLGHLHGPTLARLSRALRAAERSAAGNPALIEAGVQQALRRFGGELLLHDPAFEIRKAGFTMPEGSVALSLSVSAPGLSASDLGSPALLPALETHGQITADLRIDNALLQKLMTARGPASRFASRITAMERQGYLAVGASVVTSHLRYAAGRLTLNGKPFPAAATPVN